MSRARASDARPPILGAHWVAQVRRGFSLFDIDESGTLEKDEFMEMMQATFSTRSSAIKMILSSEGGQAVLLEVR